MNADELIDSINKFAEKVSKTVPKKDRPRTGTLHVPDARGGQPTSPSRKVDDTLTEE